jgi:hypothetical protein
MPSAPGVYTLYRDFQPYAMLIMGTQSAKLRPVNEPDTILTLDEATIMLKNWHDRALREKGFHVSKT